MLSVLCMFYVSRGDLCELLRKGREPKWLCLIPLLHNMELKLRMSYTYSMSVTWETELLLGTRTSLILYVSLVFLTATD